MNLKEFVILAYGFVMGASTPYLKPTKRFLFPSTTVEADDGLVYFLGGSGVCAVVGRGSDAIIINVNQSEATTHWLECLRERGIDATVPVVLNATTGEFAGGLAAFPAAAKIYVADAKSALAEDSRTVIVREETVIKVGDESVRLIPVGNAVTGSDLVVYLERRSVLFLGAMYYNRIHPILHRTSGLAPERWIAQLESLVTRFQPKVVVPGEGDLAESRDVKDFTGYLRSLTDPTCEFSECRKNYDWSEIPSMTSLEENFDLLRSNKKTHTTLSAGNN